MVENLEDKKAIRLNTEKGLNRAVIDFARDAIGKGAFEAVLVPVGVPSNDSYCRVLIDGDNELLDRANVLPPIMSVQGAKALSSLTKHGGFSKKTAVIMRPCEVRASIELAKLNQVDLENICLIGIDCPGVLPLKDYFADPKEAESVFVNAADSGDTSVMRPVCRTCDNFSATGSDLHIATRGLDSGIALIVPLTDKGEETLELCGFKFDEDTTDWLHAVEALAAQRHEIGTKARAEAREKSGGVARFAQVLDRCISCHNCMRVCPICYCRRCYFESDVVEHSPAQYLDRAKQKGAIRFPTDMLFFHLGRMSHMAASCVSCGSCQDACPMDIPIAEIFSAVAEDTQRAFDYTPGIDIGEPIPLRIFKKEDELEEIERICKDPLA